MALNSVVVQLSALISLESEIRPLSSLGHAAC